MKNSKLVNFILHSLYNAKDYIEYANILFAIFEKIEQEDYLNNFVISTICDRSGQINLRRAITLRLNEKDNSGIPSQILSLIPMIGSLHVSLNTQKPKPRLIDLILNLTFYGWKNICNLIINYFKNIKDIEYLILIDLLDNSLPLTLEIYAKLFRCGCYKGYLEGITINKHLIIEILKNNLPIFNGYFVENFHSSFRYQQLNQITKNKLFKSLNKRLFKSLNNDEIAEITKDNNDLDDDYEDENVETLLEETEESIDNQYEIQYNIWLNYNNSM
ncbi:hypothetical protein RclHR1_29820002 [Rhizophagus clarus]|uniref:Uncharacterized protein n=1 Tax=Rhizophagus clarus TaxID=94130 RepID=A0A2Z6R5L4_9GLOM|nr:hypothetical protein RclHR1_29820002 [Rhizophagus clarus]